ncbi:MAG: hypothetical protein ABI193_10655, partial [Minicystis sp.]
STGVATPPGSSPTVSDVGPSYRYPAVASNGTSFLVAWSRPGGIFGPIHAKRLTVPNIVFNAPVISVSTVANAQTFPAVHHDGTRWLVAWEDTRANHNLYAVRIDAQGTVLDPAGIAVTADAANHRELAIAHDAQNFFLVWDDNRAGAANYDIYGARVAGASGALLDPNGIPISTPPSPR